MKRIAHVSLHGDPLEPLGSIEAGGQNVYVKNVASHLAAQGVEVDCFTRWNTPEKARIEEIAPGARSIRLNGGPKSFVKKEKTTAFIPEMLQDFADFTRENGLKYDLVHTHYYIEGAFGLEAARQHALPLAHTFHSLGRIKLNHEKLQGDPDPNDYADRLKIEKRIMAEADLLVATSPYEAEDFAEWYDHQNKNVVVVPCGLDPKVFYPRDKASCRAQLGLPQDKTIILYVGRLDARKGIEVLLFAYRKLLFDLGEEERDVLLVIVGGNLDPKAEDEDLAHFRNLAASLHLNECASAEQGECIRFVGCQGQERVAQYYSAADMTMVPSYYEPFGMVSIESQACGTPAIASAVGGLRYGVEDGIGGLLARPYSAEDLCEKMHQLIADSAERERIARAGYHRVMQMFTWEAVGSEMMQQYTRMLATRQRRSDVQRTRVRSALRPVIFPDKPHARIAGRSASSLKRAV